MDRCPPEGQPIWVGGAASSFIMAKPYIKQRAKEEGVYSYWTGAEDTKF
jgi:hypothetical protein